MRSRQIDLVPNVVSRWTELPEQDPGITLLELLAYVADQLGYFEDAIAHESYLATGGKRARAAAAARLGILLGDLVQSPQEADEDNDDTTRGLAVTAGAMLGGPHIVYLDAWRSDVAGRAPDWQIRALVVETESITCSGVAASPEWRRLFRPSSERLSTPATVRDVPHFYFPLVVVDRAGDPHRAGSPATRVEQNRPALPNGLVMDAHTAAQHLGHRLRLTLLEPSRKAMRN